MAQHTPGPWEAVPPKKVGKHWKVGARDVLGGNGAIAGASVLWDVATIWNGVPGDTLDTEEANARLITAAPDLLAACREALVAINKHATKPIPADAYNRVASLLGDALAKADS